MKHWLFPIILMCLVIGVIVCAPAGNEFVNAKSEEGSNPAAYSPTPSAGTDWACPIAPGVWYPGEGALSEKPVRYYRVRCFPGCHKGSVHGMYPDEPLNMTPIFPTSTVPGIGKAFQKKD
ncbi:MAG: hypothetical protein PVG99_13435 [Desulfobacteraceae bacterium]|jgi:hypothetical protein